MMAKDVSPGDTKVEEKKVVKKKEKSAVQTKLVIRRLPPALTQDELLEVISPLPPHDYFRYVVGDKTLAPDNFSRAYINLTSPDDILAFRDKVDGLEFVDSKGNCQPCVLEYAPFQKNPRKSKKKEDSKSGTIEEDPDYKSFLESLQEEEEKTVFDLEKYLDELEAREQKNKCVETPLTAFLKQKREERKKIREERRRADQERRKKREEERKRRDAERKKKLEAEKIRKKKEDEKKLKEDSKKDGASNKEEDHDGRSDKSESQGKGDGKSVSKLKFESDRPKTAPRLSDTKPKKQEPVRRGPIGVKPKEKSREDNDKDGPSDRAYGPKDGHERGGYHGGRGRGRGGFRSSRDYPPRKWEKERVKTEDHDKKADKGKSKRPDREIYRPGSSRGGRGGSHKYSEQRNRGKPDDEK